MRKTVIFFYFPELLALEKLLIELTYVVLSCALMVR